MSYNFRLPPFISTFFVPLRQHPLILVTASTAIACAFLEIRASRINYQLLCSTQNALAIASANTAQEMQKLLKTTDANFIIAMKKRDEFVRDLELQNVDQTKSLTKLQTALRLCVRDPKQIPEYVKSTVEAEQKQQEQQQQQQRRHPRLCFEPS